MPEQTFKKKKNAWNTYSDAQDNKNVAIGYARVPCFFFFLFFLSLIGHNSILYKSSISLKLDFKVIEYRNKSIY